MSTLTKADLLNHSKPKIEKTTIKGLDMPACFRVMSGHDLAAFQAAMKKELGEVEIGTLLISLTLCDENGQRLFNEDDQTALLDLPSATLQRLAEAASKVNGIDESIEEAAGN